MRRLTPLQQFTLLMGAALVVGTIVLSGSLSWLLRRHLEDETVALTKTEVEVHFRDIFKDNVFVRPLTDSEAGFFDPMVRSHFGIYDIVQLRLSRSTATGGDDRGGRRAPGARGRGGAGKPGPGADAAQSRRQHPPAAAEGRP